MADLSYPDIRTETLPTHMRDAVSRYYHQGIHPGSFLEAVLSNDLVDAFTQTDDSNLRHIAEWVRWMLWELPDTAWGSRDKVKAWVEQGGMEGLLKAEEVPN